MPEFLDFFGTDFGNEKIINLQEHAFPENDVIIYQVEKWKLELKFAVEQIIINLYDSELINFLKITFHDDEQFCRHFHHYKCGNLHVIMTLPSAADYSTFKRKFCLLNKPSKQKDSLLDAFIRAESKNHCFVAKKCLQQYKNSNFLMTDGILANLIRQGSVVDDANKRWYILDGPVDAIWIENMNSVLDDNKKLCLTSGEIIKLSDVMKSQTLIFEVADLAVASPATVSRCGMIYLEPGILGLKPFYECWIEFQLGKAAKQYASRLLSLFNAFLEPSIYYMRSKTREMVPSMNSNLTFSLMKILGVLMKNLPSSVPEGVIVGLVECYFAFSLIWSVGATCDLDGRKRFSNFMKSKMELEQFKYQMPRDELVYDYKIDDGPIIADIIIASSDDKHEPFFVRTYYLHLIIFISIGPTGTGKTATISEKLTRGLPSNFNCDFINFSARTTANQTQDLIDSKLDKRRKGVFGPPPGRFLFFLSTT
uniref:Dynein heavy chain AAA 5 extension domain-containing protein n=1 Tax=Strigamia maritima TaxID=126957 RepID=T1JJ98_STRMM